MNKDIARMWVEDLRSGEFTQTTGVLTRVEEAGNEHCCLGVLCERAIKEGLGLTTVVASNSARIYNGSETMPPHDVYDWADMAASDAEDYAYLNDTEGLTFLEIADRIEAKYLTEGGEKNNG